MHRHRPDDMGPNGHTSLGLTSQLQYSARTAS